MLHRTKVVKELIEPWIYSGRLVYGDMYFASFGCVEVIVRVGMQFIGVVKTATKNILMGYLS